MNNEVVVPISSLTSQLTVNVRVSGMKVWAVRRCLGVKLIVLAARIMGVGIKVDVQ